MRFPNDSFSAVAATTLTHSLTRSQCTHIINNSWQTIFTNWSCSRERVCKWARAAGFSLCKLLPLPSFPIALYVVACFAFQLHLSANNKTPLRLLLMSLKTESAIFFLGYLLFRPVFHKVSANSHFIYIGPKLVLTPWIYVLSQSKTGQNKLNNRPETQWIAFHHPNRLN